jgi:glycosyltransferase involved in cell wall biosynthesis
MIIGIDGNEANVPVKVGIGEYAFELLKQFEKFQISSVRCAQDKNFKFQIYLKNKPNKDLPEEGEGWEYRIVKPGTFWTQFGLPMDLYTNKKRPHVFFSPTHYGPRFSPIPTVVSVMDLSYVHYPYLFTKKDLYQLKSWTAYSVKGASRVITISQSSRNDIINYYKLPEEKVNVVYPGIKQGSGFRDGSLNMENIRNKYNILGRYILFVGTIQPRKNITSLIQAFAKISKLDSQRSKIEGGDLNLVIVGKKGWLYEETMDAPKKFGVEKEVRFLDFVNDEDLPSLYKHAECFVLPSLYEGFGLPVLEAMKYGCPVVTSNVSSLPEAGGDAALYFDPEDIEDIAKTLQKVVNDQDLRSEMIKKGHAQVDRFSWKKAAGETLEILKEVGSQK